MRWMTQAIWRDGAWMAEAPEPVGEVASLLHRLRARTAATGGGIAFGIDCPLGLPRDYVRLHLGRYRNFRDYLTGLDDMPEHLQVCRSLDQVSGRRPFYPQRGLRGMRRAAHSAALGLPDAAALYRRCDLATATRAAGAPVFWTLGANQSGKAAIAAWRDLVLPALRDAPGDLHLWPFDGNLAAWGAGNGSAGRILLAETYPAEALDQLRRHLRPAVRRGSKRRQGDRAALADVLRAALVQLHVCPSIQLGAELDRGFGTDPGGEDRFDSVLGLICMISVLSGRQPDPLPDDPWVRRWEGWVLGLEPERLDTGSLVPPSGGSGAR